MEDLLIETLSEFGYPVFRQGSLNENDTYPSSFFTFWNNSADGNSYYDNGDTTTIWDYDLNFYSNNPELTYSELLRAKKQLKKAGFIVDGKGYDVVSDESTHTGRGITILFLEREVK